MLKLCFFALFTVISFFSVFVTLGEFIYFLSAQVPTIPVKDDEPPEAVLTPLMYNIGMITIFILQHTLMSLPEWKDFLSAIGLEIIERAVYLLTTAAALQLLMINWTMSNYALWEINTVDEGKEVLRLFFFLLHAVAWIVLFGATLTMDFTEFVGAKQVYFYGVGAKQPPIAYKSDEMQKLYRHMRHPGFSCFMVILWCHPVMTLSRLLLAFLFTMYFLCGHRADEDDYYFYEWHTKTHREQEVRVTYGYTYESD